MADNWQLDEAARHIKMARYLLAKADDKGKTHGEKHHLHEVIGSELLEALLLINPTADGLQRNLNDTPLDVSDIPF